MAEQPCRADRWFANGDHPLDDAVDHGYPDDGPSGLGVHTAEYRTQKGWEGDVVRHLRHPDVPGDTMHEICGRSWHEHGWINQGTDGISICPGDWIHSDAAAGGGAPGR